LENDEGICQNGLHAACLLVHHRFTGKVAVVEKVRQLSVVVPLLAVGFGLCACAGRSIGSRPLAEASQSQATQPAFAWDSDFTIVDVVSSADSAVQKAYFYPTRGRDHRPLLVHLHTWSNTFAKADPLADLARNLDWNYIHPDFRGENNRPQACCSDLVIQDIDDAIGFAIERARVDTGAIYVAGYSGGGLATLCAFMKSRHRIRSFSAWVAISDLEAWFFQSKGRQNKYAREILQVTSSTDSTLNVEEARRRSPFFMQTPVDKLANARLDIYAGIHDGYTGSVPITQSLKMYNKIVHDLGGNDPGSLVPVEDMLFMLESRTSPLRDRHMGYLGKRKILYRKSYQNVQVTIFEGTHEGLPEALIEEIQR
jgi:pimeloyl-ACP methyl ester carboxylesterase